MTILDVGRSQLTELIETSFARPVDTLGFEPDGRIGRGMHYHFNLNDAQYEERWRRDIPQYDIVVLAEVLEHLHTSPVFVLGFLRTLIRSHGLLIVQTPNAAALGKRLKILIGRNPYEPIRLDATNPGHFREYTERELRAYAHSSGMEVESLVFRSYFDQRFRSEKMGEPHIRRPWYFGSINIIYGLLPRRLRPGMTAALRRSD